MENAHLLFNRNLLRKRRNRVAEWWQHADTKVDFLHQHAATLLAERLLLARGMFPSVLDLGSRHGLLDSLLPKDKGITQYVATDISYDFIKRNRGVAIQADEEYLPFKPHSFNAIFSILNLHWVNDVPGCLHQIRQLLKPDGFFLAALFGGKTLTELRQAMTSAELEVRGGISPRIAPFMDSQDASNLLQRAGFADPVVDSEILTVSYPSPLLLAKELRYMGENNMLLSQSSSLMGKRLYAEMISRYQTLFTESDGSIPASFEIIYLSAWGSQRC